MSPVIIRIKNKLHMLGRKLLQPAEVSHRGVRIRVANPAISAPIRNAIYSGGYEARECDVLGRTLEDGDRVLELGAGLGFLGAYCSRRLGSENVCCIEANPNLETLAEETFSLNKVNPLWVTAAAGFGAGGTLLNTSKHFWSSSTLAKRPGDTAITVPTIALKGAIQDHKPTYLVCDVEGAECQLLSQDLNGIRKVLVEIHPHITGSGPINEMVSSLRMQGFIVDFLLSTTAVLFLRKP